MSSLVIDFSPIWLTVRLALTTTLVLLVLDTPLAWCLATTNSPWRHSIGAVVSLPLVLPPSVLGFYLLMALGPHGPIGGLSELMGDELLAFTFVGLVIGSVIYSMPFVVRPADHRRIDPEQAIELLGVGHLLKRQTYHLSGGEKQRVAIARALLLSPRLLLMDEPLSAFDAKSKQEILPNLERLQKELALTLILVTHALNQVFRLADEMILLDKGKPVFSGKPEELMLRHDFARAHGKQVGIVIECRFTGHDDHYHLTSLENPGGQLFIERQRLGSRGFVEAENLCVRCGS